MTDTTTLRERLARTIADITYPVSQRKSDREIQSNWDKRHFRESVTAQKIERAATAVADTLLAEIEARCAARGYTDLIGGEQGEHVWVGSLSRFIAELRGEIAK